MAYLEVNCRLLKVFKMKLRSNELRKAGARVVEFDGVAPVYDLKQVRRDILLPL